MTTTTRPAPETTSARLVNGVPVDQLEETIREVRRDPGIAAFTFRARSEWRDGARNRAEITTFDGARQTFPRETPHVVAMDEAPVLLGDDSAANPVEVLLAALSGCLTTSLVYYAAARGVELTSVRSAYEGDLDLHGFLGLDETVRPGYQEIRIGFEIEAPHATDEELDELLLLAQDHSPVYDVVSCGTPIRVVRVRPGDSE